jgi:hypothetical protein
MSQTKKLKADTQLILDRIIKENNLDGIIERLVHLNGADLKSVLLHVFHERSQRQSISEIFSSYQENYRFLGVSELDQSEIARFDNIFFESASRDFCAVELSPVCPIGLNGALAKISQNNLCSTNRGYEVVGDPTTPLALEIAFRRRKMLLVNPKSTQEVHLCTSQRILRLQAFDPEKGYMQHFRCFGLSSGGRDSRWAAFAIRNIVRQLKTHLCFLKRLNADSFQIKNIVVSFSHQGILESILRAVAADRDMVTRNTGNPEYHLFGEYDISLPPSVDYISDVPANAASYFGIEALLKDMTTVFLPVINSLRKTFPEVQYRFNLERIAGIGYYSGFCFHIHGTTADGLTLQLSDGGFTDWSRKILNNRQEHLLISGLGEDLIHKMFKIPLPSR